MVGGLAEGLGYVAGGIIGGQIGKKYEKDKIAEIERAAQSINFQELAANDPEVLVIPYSEIIKFTLARKNRLLAPPFPSKLQVMNITIQLHNTKITNNTVK